MQLKPQFNDHRSFVGPPDKFDLIGAIQFKEYKNINVIMKKYGI